jgi:hypothetical protein
LRGASEHVPYTGEMSLEARASASVERILFASSRRRDAARL